MEGPGPRTGGRHSVVAPPCPAAYRTPPGERATRVARLTAIACALVVALAGCARPTVGAVTLYFALAPDAAAGLSDVRVEPAWGGLNRGPQRDADWQRIPASAPEVALSSAPDAAPVAVARGELPAGRYDRVFVATPRVTVRTPDGRTVTLTSHIEPTVWPVEVRPGGDVGVVIDLVVLPLPQWREPGWAVFVKGARDR